MTKTERTYLQKRLEELGRKQDQLQKELEKIIKEQDKIRKKIAQGG